MILELRNITKKFQDMSGENEFEVLNELSFDLKNGEAAAIVGPSGSGKSTLLNICGTLDKPTSGEVMFNGENIVNISQNEILKLRNQEIGFVFQLHHLLPQCTVLENVLIPTLYNSSEDKREFALELIDKVGLKNRADYLPAYLSGGELQRVAVARALINNPKLLLADEPTGSLDHKKAIKLVELIRSIDEKISIMLVTHSVEIAGMMDVSYTLENGKLNVS